MFSFTDSNTLFVKYMLLDNKFNYIGYAVFGVIAGLLCNALALGFGEMAAGILVYYTLITSVIPIASDRYLIPKNKDKFLGRYKLLFKIVVTMNAIGYSAIGILMILVNHKYLGISHLVIGVIIKSAIGESLGHIQKSLVNQLTKEDREIILNDGRRDRKIQLVLMSYVGGIVYLLISSLTDTETTYFICGIFVLIMMVWDLMAAIVLWERYLRKIKHPRDTGDNKEVVNNNTDKTHTFTI